MRRCEEGGDGRAERREERRQDRGESMRKEDRRREQGTERREGEGGIREERTRRGGGKRMRRDEREGGGREGKDEGREAEGSRFFLLCPRVVSSHGILLWQSAFGFLAVFNLPG